MGNYQIVVDKEELQRFVDFLPELTEDETYYVCLFARSKYVQNKEINHINSDKAQLKRFTTNKSRLIDKLYQLECPLGSYKQRHNVVPQEALAVYINPNPRSNTKAARNALIRLAHLVTGENHGYNLHQEMISEVQKAKSRSEWIDFDFDLPDKALMVSAGLEIESILNKEAYRILETRGGYHVMINPALVEYSLKPYFYQKMAKILATYSTDKDNHGDNMIPIPGSYQGGFVPRFIEHGYLQSATAIG